MHRLSSYATTQTRSLVASTSYRPCVPLAPRREPRSLRCRVTTKELLQQKADAAARAKAAEDLPSSPGKSQGENGNGNNNNGPPGAAGASVLGAAALVAGTSVGAGILALPRVTLEAGFYPSAAALGWGFLLNVVSGLLIAEVAIATMAQLKSPSVSKAQMVDLTLGRTGAILASGFYVFHSYALLVAYVAKGGSAIGSVLPETASDAAGPVLFALSLGLLCAALPERKLGNINSVMVGLLIASFVGLVAVVAPAADPANLAARSDPAALLPALPTIALAFVYQNVVPVICAQLEGDRGKIRTAIIGGSVLPLAMSLPLLFDPRGTEPKKFMVWEAAVLGATPLPPGADLSDIDPLALLESGAAGAFGPLVSAFAFLAVATSFLGFVIGLSAFLSDTMGMGRDEEGKVGPLPIAASVLPPLFLAAAGSEELFYSALKQAGTYGVMSLFGILPPLMAYQIRKNAQSDGGPMVPGGMIPLAFVGLSATFVIGRGLAEAMGAL